MKHYPAANRFRIEKKEPCKWFARCTNQAVGTAPHPVLGKVPICQRCSDWLYRMSGETTKNPRRRVKRNPIKRPGKFEGETYAARFAYENPDDDLGDVETFGWYGKFSGKIKGRGPFHIIVHEGSQGFVTGEFYDTEKEMLKNWRRIEREYESEGGYE